MKKTANQQIVADDILRYKRNKLAQTLAILGLVFNCLYFMLLYAIPDMTMRTMSIGFSVLLTLILLLTVFLSSEGVKGYNKKFSIVLLVVAAFQILRIFYYPLRGLNGTGGASLTGIGYFGFYPADSKPFFVILLVYLVASAACLVASAIVGWIYAARLEKFTKKLETGEISVEATLKQMDIDDAKAAEAAQAVNTAEEVQ